QYASTNGADAVQNPLFGTPGDFNNALTLQTHAREFDLSDVALFTLSGGNIRLVNPYTGAIEVGTGLGSNGLVSTIAMRPDGVLFGFTSNFGNANTEQLIRFDLSTGTTTATNVGLNGINNYVAMAFQDGTASNTNSDYNNYYALYSITAGNILHRHDANTGAS